MKKLLLLWLLFLGGVTIFPVITYAHELQTDRQISAFLHVDPDDATPIAGQKSTLLLYLYDADHHFTAPSCTCQVEISKDNHLLFQQPLTFSGEIGVVNYTFPEKGIYQFRFTGQPIPPASFQAFTLSYDEPVTSHFKLNQTALFWGLIGLAGLVLISLLWIVPRFTRQRSTSKK